ncbi:MAG TPA: transporter, partial [Flavobacterium sp.]|nr:transporter [Flavobacterium sp.]
WKANQRYKWRRLVPSVALYAAADFKSKLYRHPEMPEVTLKAGIFAQQQISDHFSFVTNLLVENAESNDFRSFGYIATLSYGFNQKWSVFVENQGFFRKYKEIDLDFDRDDFITRAGITYLLHNNLQFDLSSGTTFGNQPSKFIGQIGVSWRNHKVYREKDNDK